MSRLVTFSASSRVIPLMISVRAEDEAMALAQPKVLNFASLILFFSSSLMLSLKASPQASDPTSPVPSGFSISPTFLGFRKWSFTLSVYSHIDNPHDGFYLYHYYNSWSFA